MTNPLSFHFFYDTQMFMADITQEMTAYRIKQIEFAEAEYYEQLTKVLDKIENDITSLANKSLPTTDGKLIELRAAIAIRPQIKAILEREYLAWSDTVVRQGFNKHDFPDTRCRSERKPSHALQRIKQVSKRFKRVAFGHIPIDDLSAVCGSLKFGSLAENAIGTVPVQKLDAIELGNLEGLLARHLDHDDVTLSQVPSMAIDWVRATGLSEAHMCDPV